MRSRSLSTLVTFSLFSILAMAGCGSSDSGGSDKFVGTWKFTSGTTTINCPGLAVQTEPVTGNISVNQGSTSDLVMVDEQCSLKFDVKASTTASAVPAQSCTVTGTDGTMVSTFNDAVMSSQDGATAHWSATLTMAITSGGQSAEKLSVWTRGTKWK